MKLSYIKGTSCESLAIIQRIQHIFKQHPTKVHFWAVYVNYTYMNGKKKANQKK